MTNVKELIECVDELIRKSSATDDANEALKFSQAACNAGNALAVVENIREK